MKATNSEMMTRANELLKSYGQSILIIRWTGKEITFNNQITIKGNERGKFIRRTFNKKTDLWVKSHDEIFTNPKVVDEIKSELCKRGGESCQSIHGEKIKLNLNTGTPWNAGTTGLSKSWNKGLSKDNDERLLTLSKSRIGEGNPCHGKKYTPEEKKQKAAIMRQLILEGKFTPNSNNRNTHWESSFSGKKYRSSWEAWYQYLSPHSEYETLRIEYNFNEQTKVYIVDFIDKINKIVAEVKPSNLTKNDEFIAKWASLSNWAKINDYEPKLINLEWLIKNTTHMDYSLFDELTAIKIKRLYEVSKKN